MSTRRARLDPAVGLRCALVGFDAYTGSSDQMSFDTSWTDISKLLAVGVASWVSDIGGGIPGYAVSWPNMGYIPFAEIRKLSGSVVYDDFYDASNPTGLYARVTAGGFTRPQASTSDKLLYVAYQIPVPSG
ncbi:hypothetical protein [Bradyrhizobium cenepequi]